MVFRRSLTRSFVLLFFCGASGLAAQNLVNNGDFASDVAGWASSGQPGGVAWNAADFLAAPASGAAELTATDPGTNGTFSITQCVPVTGGASYDIGARFFIPSAQPTAGSAELRLEWHTDGTCTSFSSTETLDTITTTDAWQVSSSGAHAAPGSAQSVLVIPLVTKTDAGGSFVARADGVYVRAAGSAPNVYTVHGTGDSGPGTLRNLIEQAVSDEVPSEIYFDPALAGQTIALFTALPSITESGTRIDGDLGGDCDPDIALDGGATTDADGIALGANDNTVRGLAIHSFDWSGVRVNGNDNVVECNWIGTDLAQAAGLGNGWGVSVNYAASDNRIGPSNAIRHNAFRGVEVTEGVLANTYPEFTALVADHAEVFPALDFSDGCGNFHRVGGPNLTDGSGRFFTENFGMKLTGTLTVSAAGTYTFTFPNLDDQARLNVDGGAVELDWQGGGIPPPTDVALSGSHSIRIDFVEYGGAARLQVLVTGPGTATFSSDSSPPAGCAASQPGLCGELYQLRTSAQRNTITQNGIGDNGDLGIAFSCCCGPTLNDPGDLDVGPNALLNQPVITAVGSAGGGLYTVSGTAPPNATVEAFIAVVDPSGFGEGNSFLGSGAADGGGDFAFAVPLEVGPTVLTATATDPLGNTSEFSTNFGTGGTADELRLGSASGLPATTLDVPIQVRDRSLTPLGIDRPAGQRIQRLNFTVTVSPSAGIADLAISKAGITAALTPLSESSTGALPTETYSVTYDEGSNLIPFSSDAAAPGDQIAKLAVTLAPAAAAGSYVATITGTPPNLRNQAGTTIEDESNGALAVVGAGSFTVLSNAAVALQASALSTSLVSLSWADPNQNETGFRLERSTDGTTWSTVTTKGPNDTSHLDAGLSSATLYYYRLVTRVGASDSHLSNVATATTFPATAAKVCRQRLTAGNDAAYNISLVSAGTLWAAAWTDATPGLEERVLFQRLDATGAPLAAPVQVSDPGLPGRFPTLAWNGSRFGVLWNDHKRAPDGTQPNDFTFALLDANGTVLRPHAVVGSATAPGLARPIEPVLLWDGSGWGVFAPDGADEPQELAFYRLDEDGDLLLGPLAVTDDLDWDSDYSAAWNGSVYGLAWVRHRDATYEIYFQTVNPDGTLVGSPIKIRDHAAGTSAQETDVVWNGSGWAVAWTQQDGIEKPVLLRLLDAAGNPLNTAQRISDLLDPAFPPGDDVKVVDTFPQLFNKPGGPGGYVIYTWSEIQTDGSAEAGRLEADAGGNKVGQRVILSGLDGSSDFTVRGASNGSNFLIAWEDSGTSSDIVTLEVNPDGGTLAGPTALTAGHGGAGDTATSLAALGGGGFAALWRHFDIDSNELDAKLFDGAGNLAAAKTPLVAGNVGGGAASGVVAVGNTFAVAWSDTDTGRPRFQRFDALGNALTAAVEVAPSGGGSPQLDWSGEVFGVSFAQSGLKFQRVAPDGTLVGGQTTVTAPNFNGNQGVLVRWVGSGWALLWLRNTDQNLYYARLDAAGNVVIPATAVTSAGPTDLRGPRRFQMVWNGSLLGVAWDEIRGLDPPGAEIYFTALDLSGAKQFPEIAVVSHYFSDTAPALYWDLDRFKLVSGADALREIEILPDGTVTGNERLLGSHEGAPVAAWNGAVLGILRGHQRAIEFETDECLADATPPPCPLAAVAFHSNRVALTWSAVADAESGLQSYDVYRDNRLIAELTPATLAYDDGGFVFGEIHSYEVRAFNRALGESITCPIFTVPAFANAALALLAAAQSSTTILLTWGDPNQNETGFRIERSLDGTSWSTVTTVGPDATSHLDTGLSPATLYYYRLVTLVGANDSQISNVATATTFPTTAAKVCFDPLVPSNRSWARLPSAAWDGSSWTVAWQGRENGMALDDIYLRRYDATTLAALGAATPASATDSSSSAPELVSNGAYLGLSWIESVGNPPGDAVEGNVFFSLFAADGTPVRRDVLVSRAQLGHPVDSRILPEMAWDGSHWGHFSIEQAVTPPLSDLVYRRLDWNGDVTLTAIKSLPSDHVSDVVAAWNATAGKYGVAWMQIEDTTIEIYFQRLEETTGVFEGSPVLLGSYTDFLGTGPFDVIADGAGWAVTWTEFFLIGDGSSPTWLSRLDGAGALLSNQRLSDAQLPPDGWPFDASNRLFRRPAGGYAVYFDGASTVSELLEPTRLLADANGVRTSTRDQLVPDDSVPSSRLDGSANAGNVFLAWNEQSTSTLEIAALLVNADGGAAGTVVPLTSGHSPGTGAGLVSAGGAQVARLGAGFVALWTDAVTGTNLLHARIYDGAGAVVTTLSPLSPTAVAGRPGLVSVGSTFAVAFRRPGVSETRFMSLDATGATVVAETVISTSPGGPEASIAWSGESYGVLWRRQTQDSLEFQRVAVGGAALGATVEFAGANRGSPQLHWLGDGWAALWRGPANTIRYARLASGGELALPATTIYTSPQNELPVAFSSFFNGSELGLAWSDRGADDPPLFDLFFSVMQTNGTLEFPAVTAVSSPGSDGSPLLYWDGSVFRLLHTKSDRAWVREISIQANGTVLPGERFLGAGAPAGAAWNGTTLGVSLGSVFETSACLDDPTPPPCPSVSASFDGSAVHLAWPAVGDAESGPNLYVVLRDGIRLSQTAENATSIDDRGFTHGATHDYEVRARNRAFQESAGCAAVPVETGFADVSSGDPYRAFELALWQAGVSSGCSSNPFAFCPQQAVTREQMAVFLLRAKEGPAYQPPACTTPSFSDVPCSSPFARWIEELASRGVMTSCDGDRYCPKDPVTREQMAFFLLRTVDPGLDPPACTVPPYIDVPCSSPWARWIAELAARGITSGCGAGNYCPTQPMRREALAKFIVGGFALAFP